MKVEPTAFERARLPATIRDRVGWFEIDERRRWTIWLIGAARYRDLEAIRLAVMDLSPQDVVARFIADPAFQDCLPLGPDDDQDRQHRIRSAFAQR